MIRNAPVVVGVAGGCHMVGAVGMMGVRAPGVLLADQADGLVEEPEAQIDQIATLV